MSKQAINERAVDERPADTVLTVRDLCLGFGKKQVLHHLNAEFRQGEAVLLAGGNGAGKTTFLRCLGGVYLPGAGEICPGQSLTRQKIGLISDQMSLFEGMTLEGGIDFHCRVFGIADFDHRLLNPLHFDMNQPIKSLSAGERALYHLSLLMAQQPELLLLDEIIHAVDPYLRELFLEALIELMDRFNTTVIMVNHTFSEMGRIPDRVMIMEDGRFVLDEQRGALDKKIKKIVTRKPITMDPGIPVIFKKETPFHYEYYVYPFDEALASTPAADGDYHFRDVNLAEIIKSFIGGYYAGKRS